MDKEGLYETAMHEAAHAALAHHYGWPVLSLRATALHDGEVRMILPLSFLELRPAYRASPVRARQHLTAILGVVSAPSVVLGTPTDGGDANELCTWSFVYEQIRHAYGDPPFGDLVRQARAEVAAWLQTPGTIKSLERVAEELSRRRFLDAEAFKALLRPSPPVRPSAPQVAQPVPLAAKKRPPTPAPAPSRRPPAPAPVAAQAAAPRPAAPQPQEPQEQQLSWEHLVWAYSQYFGHSRGVVPLSRFIPPLMRGSGRLVMS
jgi:hypothetical protein